MHNKHLEIIHITAKYLLVYSKMVIVMIKFKKYFFMLSLLS